MYRKTFPLAVALLFLVSAAWAGTAYSPCGVITPPGNYAFGVYLSEAPEGMTNQWWVADEEYACQLPFNSVGEGVLAAYEPPVEGFTGQINGASPLHGNPDLLSDIVIFSNLQGPTGGTIAVMQLYSDPHRLVQDYQANSAGIGVSVIEMGPEGSSYFTYSVAGTMPGSGVYYYIQSDVPEPGTWSLLVGAALLAIGLRRRF